MKQLIVFLLKIVRILIGGMIGIAIGQMVYGTILPVWNITPIGQAPNGATDIQSITYQYDGIGHLEENIVYLQTPSGELYSFFQNNWTLRPKRTPTTEDVPPIACANEWHLPAIGVVDSSGVVFEHALANEYICYVLFADGHLQVWNRITDAMNLLLFIAVGALVGMVIGAKIIVILKYIKAKMPKTKVLEQ